MGQPQQKETRKENTTQPITTTTSFGGVHNDQQQGQGSHNDQEKQQKQLPSPKSAGTHHNDFSKILAHNFSEKSPLTPKKGFDPFDFSHHEGFSLAKQGRLRDVQHMITTKKATLQDVDRYGNTMLYYSCLAGHFSVARYLLELGARDDKFSRCYLNSLSQSLRMLLRSYHNYSFSTKKKAESDDQIIEDDSLVSLLLSYVKRAIFSDQDNNEDTDMTLTIQFSDERTPATYRLHRWIIISRWPEIIDFALGNAENPLQKSDLNQLTIPALVSYDLDPREYEREISLYFSPYQQGKPNKEDVRQSVKQAHNYVNEKFQPYQLPILNEQQIESVYEKLSDINLGLAPFTRSVFEVCLAYIYTGRIISPRTKSTFIPTEKCTVRGAVIPFLTELIDAAYSLKLTTFAKVLFVEVGVHADVISSKFKVKATLDAFQEARKRELQQNLSPLGFCFESKQPTNLLDILRRKGCNMKIKLADSIEEESEEQEPTESNDVILCHKQFVTKRSQYFDIITSCGFSEGIQFREEEEKHGIATLELNCPNMEILTQLINYTYSENADITTEICIELSVQSQKLDFNVLYRKCEDFMVENLTIEEGNMIELYKLATFLGSDKLKKFWKPQTIKFIVAEIKQGTLSLGQIRENLLTELDCDEKECESLISLIQDKLDFC